MWPFTPESKPKTVNRIYQLSVVELENFCLEVSLHTRTGLAATLYKERLSKNIYVVASEQLWCDIEKYAKNNPGRGVTGPYSHR